MAGHPGFYAVLDEIRDLHGQKSSDYADETDALANYRAAEEIGVPAWKSALARALEKVERVKTFCRRGTLTNESAEETFRDLTAIFGIVLVLYREANAPMPHKPEVYGGILPRLPDGRYPRLVKPDA